MHRTSMLIKSTLVFALALPVVSSLASAQSPSLPKRGHKELGGDGSIASGANLTDCDGTLISPADRHDSDHFGTSVALDNDALIVGAPGCDVQTNDNRGAVYFYYRNAGAWYQGQKVTGVASGDNMGGALSMFNFAAVAGISGSDVYGTDAGSALTFHRVLLNVWTSDTMLHAWDPAPGDAFGAEVAMGDNWVAAAAPFKMMGNQPLAGKVYVFRNIGGSWVWHKDFTFSVPQAGDTLGDALAMRGNMLAAGARGRTVNGHSGAGAVIIGEANLISGNPFAANWSQTTIQANDPADYDHFGATLAMTDQFLYVGAPEADVNGFSDHGAVYVFQRTNFATFTQVAKIVPPAAMQAANLHFGQSMTVDGSNLIVTSGGGITYRFLQPNPNVSLTPIFLGRHYRPDAATVTFATALSLSGSVLAAGDLGRSFLPAGAEGAVQLLSDAPNDNCGNAITLSHGMFTGCTESAYNDGSSSCANSAVSPDVWYTLVGSPANIGPWILKLNSNYDTAMSAHLGACPGTAANDVACDDDSAGNFDAKLSLNVALGQTYLIRVTGYSGDSGAFQLIARHNNCPSDVSPAPLGDRKVDVNDLLAVITTWGACANVNNCPADVVGNNHNVDVNDLLAVITSWGNCPN